MFLKSYNDILQWGMVYCKQLVAVNIPLKYSLVFNLISSTFSILQAKSREQEKKKAVNRLMEGNVTIGRLEEKLKVTIQMLEWEF